MSPYDSLPPSAFWRSGVAGATPTTISGLYRKKFDISREMGIATAGSCFAQHISKHLKQRGFNILNVEPTPRGLSSEDAKTFGYDVYSARYGNIYTVRQLLQLLQESRNKSFPEDWIWERNGRYFDALRPGVEPEGLESPEEVRAHRARHLPRIRKLVRQTDLLIFTLGLTEAWVHKQSGTVYPTAPGTIAGHFDPTQYSFKNFSYQEIYRDFVMVHGLLKRMRPQIKFVITVSPVPLTATATKQHVLSATTYSKSILRAVAGEIYEKYDDVDYFPSYELIASHFSAGSLFEPNMRTVSSSGVALAMEMFLTEHDKQEISQRISPPTRRKRQRRKSSLIAARPDGETDVICEEMLLDAFAPKQSAQEAAESIRATRQNSEASG